MVSARPVEPQNGFGMRQRLSAAARDLFASQGYERTTVDAIAERAGVGRRTFFRYFRSKDDVMLPDHERIAAAVQAHLAAASDLTPVRALCSGARVVFRGYVDDRQVSVQRYRLTRSVPALRARETASVQEYFRIFRHFLATRFAEAPGSAGPDATLRADVIAGAVVAAHNQVLREWLRSGGTGDPMPALEAAFSWLVEIFERRPAGREHAEHGREPGAGGEHAGQAEDVVVAVFRTGEPIDDVIQRISRHI